MKCSVRQCARSATGPAPCAPVAVLDDQLPARVCRRQRHNQRAHHCVVLLRVLVRQEELSLAVYQHRVQLGPQRCRRRQPQLVPDVVQHGAERCLPGRAVQRDEVRRDLPRVTHAGVGQRLLRAPELRRPAHRDQLLRQRPAHGSLHGPESNDLDLQRVRGRQDLRAERPRRLGVIEQPGQPFPCGATHEHPSSPDPQRQRLYRRTPRSAARCPAAAWFLAPAKCLYPMAVKGAGGVAAGVVPVGEGACRRVPGANTRQRPESAAEPVAFGSHRKPEAILLPYEVYERYEALSRQRARLPPGPGILWPYSPANGPVRPSCTG